MQAVEKLRENGPLPASELNVQTYVRIKGEIHKIRYTSSTAAENVGPQQTMYYLPEHNPENIVRAYIELNPGLLEASKSTITRFFGNCSPELKKAWRDISGEFKEKEIHMDYSNHGPGERECGLCDETVDAGDYPNHLAEEHS